MADKTASAGKFGWDCRNERNGSSNAEKLVHAPGQLLWIEDRRRAGPAGANEGRGFLQLWILHIRIWQAAFANVPPFQALVHRGVTKGRLKELLRGRVVLMADDGEVQRLRSDFHIDKQRAG